MKSRWHLVLIVLLLIVGFAVALVLIQQDNQKTNKLEEVFSVPCNPAGKVCEVKQGMHFTLEMQQPVYLKPFQIHLSSQQQDIRIQKIQVNFTMANMNMGLNRVSLESNRFKGTWSATGLLPVCVTGRYDWDAEVTIETDSKYYRYTFPLTVKQYQ